MTTDETRRLYVGACKARRMTPVEEEFEIWRKVFANFDVSDLQHAIDAWSGDSTPDSHGQPRGRWLPAACELKEVVEVAARKRVVSRLERKSYAVSWECPGCCNRTSSFTALPDGSIDRPVTRCCGMVAVETGRVRIS